MSSVPIESEEIALLDRVLTRLGLAEDVQLEKLLVQFLTPVMQKMESPHAGTRKKVLEVLGHINKRVKPTPSIHLPLSDLVEQFTDASTPLIVKNFGIIYIEMGWPRAPLEEKLQIASKLIPGIAMRPQQHQDALLHMFVSLGESIESKRIELQRGSQADMNVLISFLHDLLLTQHRIQMATATPSSSTTSPSPSSSAPVVPTPSSTPAAAPAASPSGPLIPHGMSLSAVQRIMGKTYDRYNADELLSRRMSAVMLASLPEFLTLEESHPLLIIGAADPHHTIVQKAEDNLRKHSKVNMEDPAMIKTMFTMALGSQDKNTPEHEKRSPVSILTRIKVLHYLSRSVLAANHFPATLQMVFQGIYGADSTPRLQQATMPYVQWVFRQAQEAQLVPLAPVLLSGLVRLVDGIEADRSKDAVDLKVFTYNAIGLLGKRVKSEFANDLPLLTTLFDRLGKDDPRVTSAIYDTLNLLRECYTTIPPSPSDTATAAGGQASSSTPATTTPARTTNANALQELLLKQIHNTEHTARLMAVSYAIHNFPYSHVPSRHICVLAIGDQRPEVRDEAKRGMQPYIVKEGEIISDHGPTQATSLPSSSSKPQTGSTTPKLGRRHDVIYPSFPDLLQYLSNKRREAGGIHPTGSVAALGMTSASYEQMLLLLRNSLHRYMAVRENEHNFRSEAANAPYRELVELALGSHGGDDLHLIASVSLLDLLLIDQSFFGPLYATEPKMAWVRSLLFVGRNEARDTIGRVLGIAGQYIENQALEALAKDVGNEASDPALPLLSQYAATCALGYLLAGAQKTKSLPSAVQDRGRLSEDTLAQGVLKLYKQLSHSNVLVTIGACHSLGVVGWYAPLPVKGGFEEAASTPQNGAGTAGPSSAPVVDDTSVTKKQIVTKLVSMLSHDERKLVETSVSTLGNLMLGEGRSRDRLPDSGMKSAVLDGLYKLAGNKNEEVQFTVGEALSIIGGGEFSGAVRDPFAPGDAVDLFVDREDAATKSAGGHHAHAPTTPEAKASVSGLGDIAEHILKSHLTDRQTAIQRTAACIWLLALIKHVGHLEPIQSMLGLIQSAFSSLLADNSEVTQEVAARGMTLVYERGDESTKSQLVGGLVRTLASGAAAQKAAGSEEILPQGAMGAAPKSMGGGLSTYKELCSVASDMGKPDLIYQFLQLSSHHALWNSRKGAAFAATALADKAADQLAPFLPNLVPKLYRYSFDPNPKIAASMGNILRALIGGEPRKALDMYWRGILTEILQGMGSQQWRIREACCAALAEALSGRSIDQIGDELPEMYQMAFRALDDIKETVRKAAQGTLRTLGGLTIRMCDPSYSNNRDAKRALDSALPLLLHKGLVHEAAEVRTFAMGQISKVAKVAGPLLVPHVPDLASSLLEALAALEPMGGEFNYLALHAEKYNVTEEQLDSARMAVSRLSPLNDTLELCAKQVDSSNIDELMSKLVPLIRGGVGLATRAGVAKFIRQLAQSHGDEVGKFSSKLLPPLLHSLDDRSALVRKGFANTLSYVVKSIPTKATGAPQVNDVIQKLMGKYRDAVQTGEGNKDAVAVAFSELMKNAVSSLLPFQKEVVPFLYFAKNDPTESISKIFQEIWTDSSLGSARVYLREVILVVHDALQSNSWVMKQQAALTLSALGQEVGRGIGEEYINVVLKLVLDGLRTRTYKGKEAMLTALSSIAVSCKEIIPTPAPIPSGTTSSSTVSSSSSPSDIFTNVTTITPKDMVLSAINESKRSDLEYRRHAVNCLATVLKTYPCVDLYNEVKEAILPNLVEEESTPSNSGSSSNTEPDAEEMKQKPLMMMIRSSGYEAMGYAYAAQTLPPTHECTLDLATLLATQFAISIWKIQLSILTAYHSLIMKHSSSSSSSSSSSGAPLPSDVIVKILESISWGLDNAKYSEIRKASLETLIDLANVTRTYQIGQDANISQLGHKVHDQVETLRKDATVAGPAEKAKAALDNHPLVNAMQMS
eukprot:TRINITY_DN3387_c0_g1_i2.p1 TRINITY_DN3387_c0_g1~~TRINITY_DN3387_c0_g1_i2.p1  ORF type:complete len:1971 (+),score=451.33 TRINITY_DN3387_c0_g1_i2:78-5990(+)